MNDALNVLLVDDDKFTFDVIVGYLEGARLSWAGTYEDGLDKIRTERPDVCLLDYQLGNKSGLNFLRELRATGCRVPIVMLTAQDDRSTDFEAMKAGAADFLVKGAFDPPLLERALRYAVEQARMVAALRDSEERYALAVAGANDGIWDWKLDSNEIYFSPRWKAILGFEEHELPNCLDSWHARVHPDDRDSLTAQVAAHVAGRKDQFECEHRVLHKDGSYRWVRARGLAVFDPQGKPLRMAGSLNDITHARGHDTLTGLPNRVLYMDLIERAIERIRRHPEHCFAVLCLDMDRFKIVNDSLGHLRGDELIVAISKRLQKCLRAADTVARLGGDEFSILLDDIAEASDATRVVRRIQHELEEPFQLDGRDVFTSASIGIALASPTYKRPEEILRDADSALNRAKALGKSRHEVFDKGMHERALAILRLETDLRQAIEARQLQVFYQPIISLETGKITGFEALVRWKHVERGFVPPDEFIPLAEETGLVVQIDRFVMHEACNTLARFLKSQPQAGRLTISVNVSKREFAQNDFVDAIEQTLKETGLDPSSLCLEITESAIMDNAVLAESVLNRLKAQNIQLVMDDFGTGYSSLSYLHRMPFAVLKVDRSFVGRMTSKQENAELVRTIIDMANNLTLRVTAEGVETQEQLDKLRSFKCHSAQGYFFSRPVDGKAAEALLAQAPCW